LVWAVAGGDLPGGTPAIASGNWDDKVRVWRLADGARVGEPLRGHTGEVRAVAVGALADGAPIVPPLRLPESVRGVAVRGNIIVTATGPTLPFTNQCPSAEGLAAVPPREGGGSIAIG
jgi:hypothetical protein